MSAAANVVLRALVIAPCRNSTSIGSRTSGGEYLVGPPVIEALNGKIGLVRPLIPMGTGKALSQSLKAFEPMGPLGLTFA
jgi:hypothetical protein